MSLKRFLLSRLFLKNLLLAVIVLIVLIVITMQGLKIYTRHGQANPVPDFSGLTPVEAFHSAKQHDLKIEIVDSLYVDDVRPGVTVDQVPDAGHKVKKHRTIFLTINSTNPELVTLPQLTDISFRQSQALIENSGLQIGRISYQPSEYNNLVLAAEIDSVKLSAGQKLPKGTKIDLIVGREQGNLVTLLPNLTGLTVEEAKMALTDAMLNTGVVIYDNSVLSAEDSLNAQVWRQRPNPKVTASVNLGSSVDLWVTVDQLKIEDAMELFF